MQTYFAKLKQYAPNADPTNSQLTYGWDQAAILVVHGRNAERHIDAMAVLGAQDCVPVHDRAGPRPGMQFAHLGGGLVRAEDGCRQPDDLVLGIAEETGSSRVPRATDSVR